MSVIKARGMPTTDVGSVTKHGFKDYALRFGFGAGISLIAGLLGMWFGPKLGGVFLGFPAILPASLTLIQKQDGKEQAAIDSEGAVLGAMAFVVFAVFVTLLLQRWGVVGTVVVGLVVWTAVAIALYAIARMLWRREPSPP